MAQTSRKENGFYKELDAGLINWFQKMRPQTGLEVEVRKSFNSKHFNNGGDCEQNFFHFFFVNRTKSVEESLRVNSAQLKRVNG